MELRNLQTFSKVCETMSFSRAAEELGYAQSTVTAQVAQMEEELGVPLFDRSGKRFRLNAKGEELLAYANRLTALADEARASVSDNRTPRGLLRLGTIDSLGTALLPAVLRSTCWPALRCGSRSLPAPPGKFWRCCGRGGSI